MTSRGVTGPQQACSWVVLSRCGTLKGCHCQDHPWPQLRISRETPPGSDEPSRGVREGRRETGGCPPPSSRSLRARDACAWAVGHVPAAPRSFGSFHRESKPSASRRRGAPPLRPAPHRRFPLRGPRSGGRPGKAAPPRDGTGRGVLRRLCPGPGGGCVRASGTPRRRFI